MSGFFAKPNLDNLQFNQLPDSILTLSGQTQIANITGLTITDENNVFIPIIVTGGTNYDVLTYVNGKITLEPVAGGGSGVYSGASPTTCSVGGLASGSAIAGSSISDILQCMLVPTLNPTLTPNTISMSISPSATVFELGCSIGFTPTIVYNSGTVSPVYCGGTSTRTGVATCYVYTNLDGSQYSGVSASCLMPNKSIVLGNNTVFGVANYSAGIAPLKSNGSPMSGVTCGAGSLTSIRIVGGILPYYWGKSTVLPITNTCVVNGTKVVSCASGILPITYNSSASDYLWFAVPNGTPAKTCWYVNGTNNGAISGVAGQTWAQPFNVTGTSISGCWSNRVYNVYVTCLPTGTASGVAMCFC